VYFIKLRQALQHKEENIEIKNNVWSCSEICIFCILY